MKDSVEQLNLDDKEAFKKNLESLIEQTYAVEKEYKELKESYNNLQNFIKQVVEVLPNAIWVIENDGSLFLENSEAKKISTLFAVLQDDKESYEVEHKGNYYLIKNRFAYGKKIVSATDITKEKRDERLASMGQIAAHLSHEIRNPIGSVSLMASTLFKRVNDQNKPLVEEIKKAIWRVERIIKATLLFTKGIMLNKTKFDLNDLKNELNDALNYYSYSKDIEFIYNFQKEYIEADFDLLSIVLQNFIFNAIDAIEEDEKEQGVITVSFKKESDKNIFTIKDTAPMIDDKSILYEPFKTTKTKGHGLGLALSMEIIKAHEGTIKLLQKEKGFEITICG